MKARELGGQLLYNKRWMCIYEVYHIYCTCTHVYYISPVNTTGNSKLKYVNSNELIDFFA